ncbi:lipopolysaccharide/colanic/teichoic acid biosynthesis glycosyltransferase [Sphingopyxis panaciterrae]|uniref:sugar transferase n=1 Tax=Sphingopyxis panaciterrae TaxID=363841 RepID=UPI00142325C7|nr:sugar transferase [Sphingopyxis panaciterrae]NIJ36418.1 lipopolysaccharide/colanic/teichoic acid biosynthesis glycosyltransferase [Sphingopyxis panaciterrae]
MTIETSNRYDFIVTGASGDVGRHLVPALARRGGRILAVDPNPDSLRTLYEGVTSVAIADYEALADEIDCDTLIHLAAGHDDQARSPDDFAAWIGEQFNRMNGRRFINIASIRSLDDDDNSPQAVSEAVAQRRIAEFVGDRLDQVHIGHLHSKGYYGEKLGFLNGTGAIGAMAFALFKALKPTTSVPSLADYAAGAANMLPVPGILTDDLLRSRIYRTVTRMLDIAVAVGILLVLMPLLAILWVAIRADSPGPAIFKQSRIGKAQAAFTLYKFRTMKRDTANVGTHEVGVSAVTKIGKFLRATKLDELPQAINLLRGEMTLVGPRPCLFSQRELIDAREAVGVFSLKPGITGYAQIREIDMSRPQELAVSDYTYMKLQSLALNLRIIIQTGLGRGSGDRVVTTPA